MQPIKNAFDGLRNPEYTGDNRCSPCTLLNSGIALLLAVLTALVWPPGGAVVLIVSLLAIAFRGYLIPGTPTLTARYLPQTILERLDKIEPPERVEGGDERADGNDAEDLLLSAGVVEVDPETDDLRFTDQFRDDWWRRARRFRDGGGELERLATILDVEPRALSLDAEGETGRVTVSVEERVVANWVSEAAFYADLATESALREWTPRWDELNDERRTALIGGLRAFLEACPLCETALEPVENVRKSCCSSDFVRVTVDCAECSSRVFSGTYR